MRKEENCNNELANKIISLKSYQLESESNEIAYEGENFTFCFTMKNQKDHCKLYSIFNETTIF